MEPLKPLQTKTAVAAMLREEIFSGALLDGAELVQEALAEQLGVSRMPVREALQQLELEGVLQRLPNRHMRVVGITPRFIEQNFSMLAAMECEFAATALLETLSVELILSAAACYRTLAAQSTAKRAAQELLFHSSFAECLQNPCLCRAHRQLLDGYFAYVLQRRARSAEAILARLESIAHALERKNLPECNASLRGYFEEAVRDALETIGGNHACLI